MRKKNVDLLTAQILGEPIEKVLRGFITERKSRMLSPKTIIFYEQELRYFVDYLGEMEINHLDDISPDVIRQHLIDLSGTCNPGGCHAAYRAIKTFVNWVDNELEPTNWRNPIRKVAAPSVKVKAKKGVEPEYIIRLIDHCNTSHSVRDKAILMFLFDTGVRASELIDVNIGDIDIHTGATVIRHGKGDKKRVVFMGKKTLKQVRRYLKTLPSLNEFDPLFQTDENSRFTYSGLRMVVRRRAADVGMKEPGLHDFRRAFARQCLRNGMDLITVSRLLGHSNVAITQRYIYQDEDDLAQAHNLASPMDRM